jgi:glycosyltransferase involved in cell wall biosynthesis
MDAAQGDAIVVMDADLQDPPEVVEELIAKWKQGYEVVYARRLSRAGESRFKRLTAHLFYRLLGRMSSVGIPADVGDFRLIDRKVLEALQQMPEQDRFVRGMIAWLGFKQTEVTFHRLERVAGETKYPLWKMARLALTAALSFFERPCAWRSGAGSPYRAWHCFMAVTCSCCGWAMTAIWSLAGRRPSSLFLCCAASTC